MVADGTLTLMTPKGSRVVVDVALAIALSLGVACPGWGGQPVTIGGPFTLRAADGAAVTDQTFRGKWLLVYFGYTSCPNSCPTALMDISQVLAGLGSDAGALEALFITVDPQRDTSEVLRQYTASFDQRIIGLSGDPHQIAAVAQAYGVYYAPRKIGPGAEDYVIDHSSYIYLMDPLGSFARGFEADTAPDRIAQAVRELLHPATPASAQDNRRAW